MMIDANMMGQEMIDRRAMMAQIAILLGATALPAEVFAAGKRPPAKRFLTVAQLATLSAVADTLVPATDTPGALAAKVPATLDGMLLKWASTETRTKVLGALSRLDGVAVSKTKKGFAALTPAQRKSVLTGFDKAALKAVPPPPGAPKANFFTQIPYVVDPGYLALKGLVINLYYSSEIAMTKELIYEHNPGKFEPSIKATAATRPWASTGPF